MLHAVAESEEQVNTMSKDLRAFAGLPERLKQFEDIKVKSESDAVRLLNSPVKVTN
jgi:hypothetical protein